MTSKTTNKFSSEVRGRAVRMFHQPEHSSRWAAIVSIAAKIGCTAPTLNELVKKAERDSGKPGLTSDMAGRLKGGRSARATRRRQRAGLLELSGGGQSRAEGGDLAINHALISHLNICTQTIFRDLRRC